MFFNWIESHNACYSLLLDLRYLQGKRFVTFREVVRTKPVSQGSALRVNFSYECNFICF
jgi:hypothetical protein